MSDCSRFAPGSVSRRLCESDNRFREMHGLKRLEEIDSIADTEAIETFPRKTSQQHAIAAAPAVAQAIAVTPKKTSCCRRDRTSPRASLSPGIAAPVSIKTEPIRKIRAARNNKTKPKKGPLYVPPRGFMLGQPIDRERLTKHIIYHIMPLAGDSEPIWRRHVQWLKEVRSQFNGRMIIGIVTKNPGDRFEYVDPEVVKKEFEGVECEFIISENDIPSTNRGKGIGEGVTFWHALEMLQTTDENSVIFYGHAKGVTKPKSPLSMSPHRWAKACFDIVFRNSDRLIDSLDYHAISGPFRRWKKNKYFSGAFFAMRAASVFSRDWRKRDNSYGCVEFWPAKIFDLYAECDCVFGDNAGSLYDDSLWPEIEKRLEEWKSIRVVFRENKQPGVTLITPTGDRQESFLLCEKWMSRQTYTGPFQWIVVDDGKFETKCNLGQQYVRKQPHPSVPHTLARNLRAALPLIVYDKILIIEDDEWYSSQYIEKMVSGLDKNMLYGAGYARYYWPRELRFREFPEHKHGSLCRTGFRSEVLKEFEDACRSNDPSVDMRFWAKVQGEIRKEEPPLVIGMKGMPGRECGAKNYSKGTIDTNMSMLRKWIGDDIADYASVLRKKNQPHKESIVVYTVVNNGYDVILPPKTKSKAAKYVAVTDGFAPHPWEVRSPPEPTKNHKMDSRRWKLNSHILFPDADWTIYLDGQLQLIVDPEILIEECRSWGDGSLYLFRHQDRDCLYKEATEVARIGKDKQENFSSQIERYKSCGLEEDYGLYLGGMLIRKKSKCNEFNEMWWDEVSKGSHRDQISLPFCLKQSKIDFVPMPRNWWKNFFSRKPHAGKKK